MRLIKDKASTFYGRLAADRAGLGAMRMITKLSLLLPITALLAVAVAMIDVFPARMLIVASGVTIHYWMLFVVKTSKSGSGGR